MDRYTFHHLVAWVAAIYAPEQQLGIFEEIYDYVRDHPEIVDPEQIEKNLPWPEVLGAARREFEFPEQPKDAPWDHGLSFADSVQY